MGQGAKLSAETLVSVLRRAGCVFAEDEAAILLASAGTDAELADMLARRVAGHPLEHIVGWASFCGLRISVSPGVFVPRQRSGFLVERALAVLLGPGAGTAAFPGPDGRTTPPPGGSVVLDLCCGSGAVGAALAQALAESAAGFELHAADVDPAAVACAALNIARHGGTAHCGDLFDALPEGLRGRIDVVAANPPYVPAGAIKFMPQEARLHEPGRALNGGVDGLDLHRRIAREAPQWLRPGGVLLLESSAGQAPASAAILTAHGFAASIASSERLDGTVVTGVLEAGTG